MSFFLAIDAGGTGTRCLLTDETRVLARATAGTVKLMRVGEPEATARLQAMLAEVAAAAGVSLNQISHLPRAGRNQQPRCARVGQPRSLQLGLRRTFDLRR